MDSHALTDGFSVPSIDLDGIGRRTGRYSEWNSVMFREDRNRDEECTLALILLHAPFLPLG